MKNQSKINWSNHFIELIIVIVGISIAFGLNNLAVESREENQKIAYLSDIKNDLEKDSVRLSINIRNNEAKKEKLQHALTLISESAPVDSVLIYILEIGNYDFFSPDNFTLTSLLQSGDLKLIESKDAKRELLRLLKIYDSINIMQLNFLQALDDNYFPMLLTKVDMMEFKAVDPQFFYGIEIRNYCVYTLNETSRHINSYKFAQKQVSKVMAIIEMEITHP